MDAETNAQAKAYCHSFRSRDTTKDCRQWKIIYKKEIKMTKKREKNKKITKCETQNATYFIPW